MPTITERPFPCGDNTFIDSVLADHIKTSAEHDEMVGGFSGEENPAPFIFVYSQHEIPTDCNAYYVKITFDTENISNDDILVEFKEWPDNEGPPTSKSGEVYFSMVFFNGMRTRKGATTLQIRKAIESTEDGEYVGVVVKGFKGGSLVYTGDLTSQFPIEKGNMKEKRKAGYDCTDEEFLWGVLTAHEISVTSYNDRILGAVNSLSYSPLSVQIGELTEDTGCSDYLIEIRYDIRADVLRTQHADMSYYIVEWPTPDPVATSGCVYFSVILFKAIQQLLNGHTVEFRKAIEIEVADNFYAAVIAVKDEDGNLVYLGNLTSQLPLIKDTALSNLP